MATNIVPFYMPTQNRQGEIVYKRFVASVKQQLSFRVAAWQGVSQPAAGESDVDLLHRWMNDPRVSKFWGEDGPKSHQEKYLKEGIQSNHSIPLIGYWDNKPFGYFEVYWVKKDKLGLVLDEVGEYDRGIHCLVGDKEFRGAYRVEIWLSSLIEYCFLSNPMTEVIMMEPRIDNAKMLDYCTKAGFVFDRVISLSHKDCNLVKIFKKDWLIKRKE